MIRIAAAGDVHASELTHDRIEESFRRVGSEADIVLLAGDLTAHGDPNQARVLAEACRDLGIPVCAVLGNHDLHEGKGEEVAAILSAAGVDVLDRDSTVYELNGMEVGVVGAKGFIGGFPGSALPDFGEPLLRRVYAETTEEVDAISRGLQEIGYCELRIVLLHYAPTADTLQRESGRTSAATDSPCRSPNIARMSFCTVTRMPGRSKAQSGRCRSTTSRYT